MSPRERPKLIRRLADLIDPNLDQLAPLEALDSGVPHAFHTYTPREPVGVVGQIIA